MEEVEIVQEKEGKNTHCRIGLETRPCFCNSSYASTCCIALQSEQSEQKALPLFVPCLLISKSQPPRPQPCNLCVYNVFPFCFARASSSRAKYVTLHSGLPFGVLLKLHGSTCCSQKNQRMHHPSSITL